MRIGNLELDDAEVLTHARAYARAQLRIQRGWGDANDYHTVQLGDQWVLSTLGPQGIAAMRPIVAASAATLLEQEASETAQSQQRLGQLTSAHQSAAEARAAALRNAGANKLSTVAGVAREKPLNEEQLLGVIGDGKYQIPPQKRYAEALAENVGKRVGKRIDPNQVRQVIENYGKMLDEPSKLQAAAEAKFPGDVVGQNRWKERVATDYAKAKLAERQETELAKRDPDRFTKPVTVEATNSEKIRATIADALVSADPRSVLDDVHDTGKRDKATGEPEDLRASVADAVAAHWEEPSLADAEAAEERMNALDRIAQEEGLI